MIKKSTENKPEGRVKTLDEVASLLRISRGSAYEAARRKEIPTIRIGRRLLVPAARPQRAGIGSRLEAARAKLKETIMSWLAKLQAAKAEMATQKVDPWRLRLERVRGHVGDDGIERISTQTLFDHLEVLQRSRAAGACRRLAQDA